MTKYLLLIAALMLLIACDKKTEETTKDLSTLAMPPEVALFYQNITNSLYSDYCVLPGVLPGKKAIWIAQHSRTSFENSLGENNKKALEKKYEIDKLWGIIPGNELFWFVIVDGHSSYQLAWENRFDASERKFYFFYKDGTPISKINKDYFRCKQLRKDIETKEPQALPVLIQQGMVTEAKKFLKEVDFKDKCFLSSIEGAVKYNDIELIKLYFEKGFTLDVFFQPCPMKIDNNIVLPMPPRWSASLEIARCTGKEVLLKSANSEIKIYLQQKFADVPDCIEVP